MRLCYHIYEPRKCLLRRQLEGCESTGDLNHRPATLGGYVGWYCGELRDVLRTSEHQSTNVVNVLLVVVWVEICSRLLAKWKHDVICEQGAHSLHLMNRRNGRRGQGLISKGLNNK